MAAVSFSSDVYRCAVSINGVSDLPRMLRSAIRDHGRDHWIVAYWETQYGNDLSDRDELTEISPARHADAVSAPVLLIHANKDTVVSVEQSRVMNRALKKAGKDVELVVLKGEDHWLSYADTRLATLEALDRFLKTNL